MKDEEKLKKLARDYLLARKKFRDEADKISELAGNDNIVGRIGEFIAILFLEKELKRKKIIKNPNQVERGNDIVADGKKVSVKIITFENIKGRTTPIKDPWDELIFIELGENLKVSQIGYISSDKFREATREKFLKNVNPITSRSMLKKGRLFDRYGKIFTSKDISEYL